MKPDEFWDLTPLEIVDLIEAYEERIDLQMQMIAWHAANVMNVHLKRRVTVKQLLGKEKKMNADERQREFEKLKQKMEQVKQRGEGEHSGEHREHFGSNRRRY